MAIDNDKQVGPVTLRAFVIGVILSGLFAWITAMRDNAIPNADPAIYISGNLIPVLPHVMLLLAGILINPILKRVKIIRQFCKEELLLIFVMCAVSAGIATWGFSGQLMPRISGLSNKAWNTDQRQWDIHVMPFLNENYFIAGEGTQAAAKHLRDVHMQYEHTRKVYQTARDLQLGKAELAKLEAELDKIAAMPESKERAIQERVLLWPHTQTVKLLETTTERWEEIGADLDPAVVVDTYGDIVDKLKVERDLLREEIKELNKGAFEAVEEIRKGLPQDKRAFPGFFYSGGEGFASYAARSKRLRIGCRSKAKLAEAETALSQAIESGTQLPASFTSQINEAADLLNDISDIPVLSALNDKLTKRLEKLEDEIADQKAEGRHMRHLRRYSKQNQFESFNDRIEELDASIAEVENDAKELRDRVEKQVRPLLDVCELVKEAHSDLLAISEDASNASSDAYPDILNRLQSTISSYASFDASMRRFWLGDAKWRIWLRPVFNWMMLAFLGYMVLMAFNTLIFRQWAHNEKLIYPLAEIASIVAGGSTSEAGGKPLFKSGLFWAGFALAAGILGWNYLAKSNIVPNISQVNLETGWWNFFHGDSLLRGLRCTYFSVIFAVVGISFLVPSGISFSLWFFEVMYLCLLLVLVWLGYGDDRQSMGNVGRSAIGTGAMLVFGVVILFTCRQYLLCAFSSKALKGLDKDEAKELRVSSALFLGGSAILLSIMTFVMGANPLIAILFFLITLTVVIALVRVVAEGGLLGLEGAQGGFAIMKTIFGTAKVWGAPLALAPLGLYMSLFFGGTKAFIAPMMANSLKVREQFKMRRLYFHGAIWTAITIAAVISMATLIIISYDRGADNLHGWLNKYNTVSSLDGVKAAVTSFKPVKTSDRLWMLTGALLMGGLLFGRRRVFGIPHPIGLIMLMNPSMLGFWGSILLGWMFKSIVSKYCSNEQYVAIRRFFVGLVLGHLLAILFGWDHMDFHWG